MSLRSRIYATIRGLCSPFLLGSVVSLRPIRRANPRQPITSHHVDDPEADVDRMVRDPFEIPVHEQVPRPGLDAQLSLAHPTDEVAEVPVMQLVDRIVHLDHVADYLGVAPDERVHRGADRGAPPSGPRTDTC